MNTVALAWRFLAARPLAAALNALLLALGVATVAFMLLADAQIERALQRDVAGIDLVVGAKGSPLQLILAGVYHLDAPAGNVPLAEVQALARHPQVAEVLPLSLGDSVAGHRIVGTVPGYLALYGARLAEGALWQAPMQAVAGAGVALPLGSRFAGQHGLGQGGPAHEAEPYTLVGRLAPCACVLDRLVLTSLESVWQVHEDEMATDADDRRALEAEREVTLALVRYATPLAAATLPRQVNAGAVLQAAAPAFEITRLLRLLGVASEVLRGFGALLLAAAALSVFAALWNAVRERRADLGLLRLLGAPPRRLAALVFAEAAWLAAIGSAAGLLLAHGALAIAARMLAAERSLALDAAAFAPGEAWLPLAVLALALLAATMPAVQAYRLPATELLET